MKTKLIILEQGNIIVSDKQTINNDNLVYYVGSIFKFKNANLYDINTGEWRCMPNLDANPLAYKEVIASDNPEHNLPNINYNGLEENFGIVHWSRHWEIVNQQLYGQGGVNPHAYRLGFKKSQSLNDKKFSLEDMRKITQAAFTIKSNNETLIEDFDKWFNIKIQSLQQPRVFEVEIEYLIIAGKGRGARKTQIPKTTDNKIKITKVLTQI